MAGENLLAITVDFAECDRLHASVLKAEGEPSYA